MTLKTSLVITGDSSVAKAAVDTLRGGIDQLGSSAKTTAPAAQQLDKAIGGVATTARAAAFQLSDLSQQSAAQRHEQEKAAEAAGKLNTNIGLQRAGYQQLGFQIQDVAASYASGSRLSTIFAQQSGQLAGAIGLIAQASEDTNSKLGKFATFIGGPWGIALNIAIALGAALWSSLSKVDDASQEAAKSTFDFSSSLQAAQGSIATYTDAVSQAEQATRGLINTQALLIDNSRAIAKQTAADLTGQIATLDAQIAQKTQSAGAWWKNVPGLSSIGVWERGQITTLQQQRSDLKDELGKWQKVYTDAQVGFEERSAVESASADARARGEIERARARLRERRQFTLNSSTGDVPLADGASLDYLSEADFKRQMSDLQRREDALKERDKKPKKDNSAAKAAREAERLAQFGERAEDAIARLNDQFNAAPRDIDQARQATGKLDDIIADLEKRKPKNFETLIAQAQAVKPLIQESLQRPIREMLDDQQRQIALGALQVQGREAEASALQVTYSLMDKLGVESESQLATELAKRGVTGDQVRQLYGNLELMREQTREMKAQQAIQQAFLTGVADMRENVRLTLESLRKDGPKAFGDFFKRSLDVVDRLFSDVAVEKLFGGIFRDLEDQVTGADKVSDAGDKMAKAVDAASGEIINLGKAAATAIATMKGAANGSAVPAGWIVGDDGKAFDPNAAIEVTAAKIDPLKELKGGFRQGYEQVFGDLKKGMKDVFSDIFGDRGLFSSSLGKTLGTVVANGQVGATAGNLVTGLLGIKGSSTVGALGGAIGGAIGGPIGSIVGGVLGSVVGGLFKKTKTGAANITSVTGDAVLSGNSSTYKKSASAAAGSVQDGLSQIAETLGGGVGSFNVTIGQRDGDWRVRAGSGSLKVSKGATDFNDDQSSAIAYAIQLAVSQGAITGLSAAVQKAIKSSDDINDALAEALKVKEVETLLGGIGAELQNQFQALETQAKERLRIATEYGFDVVAIEKKNAEDRAKLVDQLLTERIGSIQTLLNDLKYGDLYEGSLADQRQALLAEIAKAKTAAEAGEDGAADKLATLSRQLVELSRDAYGTAGSEYASDRDSVINASENILQIETDRIQAAADAAAQTNTTLSTISDQTAVSNDLLAKIAAALTAAGGTNAALAAALNTSLVSRTA
ncbi:hypothetical protein HHL26_04595 [Sphingobium sp. TB-6]|uniref:hypothetical protein n=1 Tax=Sphingobium sp. TB-6 TaxID=2728850 RepID=UPI00146F34A9|nr:hypothetical protein [Sphingobium sp. TB-6]NML88344.1 hypothetical protein [Sphingobium sp. TB-6]